MGRTCETKPHFFKIMLGDFSRRLRIPPAFMKHITEKASKNAILEGPGGSLWHVKLEKALHGTFFQVGWPEFVNDHTLQAAEFLVFRYNGNLHFTVQIFGVNACEREDLFTVKSSRECTFYKRKWKQGDLIKIEKNGKDGVQALQKSFNQNLTGSNGGSVSKPSQTVESDPFLCTKGNIKIEPDSFELDEGVVFQPRNVNVGLGTSAAPWVKCQHVLALESIASQQMKAGTFSTASCKTSSGKGFISTRRPVTENEKARAWTAACSLNPKYPYFKKVMTKTSVCGSLLLRIPHKFCKKYLPKERSKMIILDPSGKKWEVVYSVHLGKHGRLSGGMIAGGWSSLIQGTNLEEGDACVFELVKKDEMHMHIFRVVQELTPLIKISR